MEENLSEYHEYVDQQILDAFGKANLIENIKPPKKLPFTKKERIIFRLIMFPVVLYNIFPPEHHKLIFEFYLETLSDLISFKGSKETLRTYLNREDLRFLYEKYEVDNKMPGTKPHVYAVIPFNPDDLRLVKGNTVKFAMSQILDLSEHVYSKEAVPLKKETITWIFSEFELLWNNIAKFSNENGGKVPLYPRKLINQYKKILLGMTSEKLQSGLPKEEILKIPNAEIESYFKRKVDEKLKKMK